ncbi:MAG: hypothetical protein BMS9Abin37_2544 [Acidobacteriota bacterium]|nr:MAG: hypothetical protein BMS9Abin37_2544 [Acidobacteriota bacterium]
MTFRLPTLVLLFAAVYGIQSRIDESFGPYRATEEILYVDRGNAMKRVLLGFDNVAADLYWLRTVQYFGGKRLDATNKDYRLLAPLLNITVELDPNFKIAYSYGATFFSEPFPTGAGQPLKGIEIIDKGIANHPEYWRFYLDKGFIYFWFLNDYEKAAEVFLEGSKLPGAPYWMLTTATSTLTRGGDRETARNLWHMIYQSAETSQQKDNATIHLKQLDALDEMDRLRRVIEAFHQRAGRYPSRWQELVDTGFLEKIPVDPAGTAYVLNPETHAVVLGRDSLLGGLPRE